MSSQDRKFEPTNYQDQLILEASLKNKFYSYNKLEPTVYFWKELTTNPNQTPMCFVPDTLVLNEKDIELMWIYTDSTGHLRKETNIHFKDFINKLTGYSSPNELVAILKRPISSEKLTYSNDFKLLNSRYLLNMSQQQLGQKEQVVCLQRFIKSNGAKAFLCRTIYNRNCSSECFLITNTRNFYDNEPENKKFVVRPGDKSTIVKSKQGKNLEETNKYLKQIVQYMMFFRGITIEELVGDFVKDETGNWWLVNIKAFKAIEKLKKNPRSKNIIHTTKESNEELEKERYQKTKQCRYCEKNYLDSELTFKMTMRMIIEVDKYLLHMGKEYNWLKRSDISNIDSHILYQEHKVCSRCFRLYSEIQSLMQIEKKFLVKQGCILPAHPKELIFSQTNEEHLRLQAKNKEIYRLQNNNLPEIIELGPNTNITMKEHCPIKNDEIINKMTRFRLIIFLNEIDQVVDVDHECNYYLEFTLFNKKSKYKLNMSLAHDKIIPLNKLKVFYFFAHSIENLEQEYIQSNPSFKMHLVTEHKETKEKRTIGNLELSFKDLIIPVNRKKDFYKFFHVEKISYGWGLEGSIGIIPSEGDVTTAKISFEKSEGKLYIPNENYYFCEALSEEWVDLIKAKSQRSALQRSNLRTTVIGQSFVEKERKTNNPFHSGIEKSYHNLAVSKFQIEEENHDDNEEGTLKKCQSEKDTGMERKRINELLFNEIENYEKSSASKKNFKKVSRINGLKI